MHRFLSSLKIFVMRVIITSLLSLSFAFTASAHEEEPKAGGNPKERVGYASYYHDKFHGRKTANGEIYDKNELSAAHLKLPMGTRVKVTRLDNGKEIVVRINDRGPYSNYMIDLSRAAAAKLGLVGIKRKVSLEILDKKGNRIGTVSENGEVVANETPITYETSSEIITFDEQQPPVITAEGELQRSGVGKRTAAVASGQAEQAERPARGKRGRHAHSRRGGKHAHGKAAKHSKRGGKAKASKGNKAKGGKAKGGKRRRR